MRQILLLVAVLVSFTGWGEDKYYNTKAEQEALKKAYEIIKVFYPANTVCASDSVYDHNWVFSAGGLEKEIKDELFQLRLDKHFVFDAPVYSQNISRLLSQYRCECDDYKFEAEFSASYKGMILCEVRPKDRKVGTDGMPTIYTFLFRFDSDGEIYQINKSLINFD